MKSNGVIITGFQVENEHGESTFEISRKDIKDYLNEFYFKVHRNHNHPEMTNKLEFIADKDIHCEIGKRNRTKRFNGFF